MNYLLVYSLFTFMFIIFPLIFNKYIFLINSITLMLILGGYLNYTSAIFILLLLAFLFRFIFLNNMNINKFSHIANQNLQEDFTNKSTKNKKKKMDKSRELEETGVEEFYIKDKFTELHELIHQYEGFIKKSK